MALRRWRVASACGSDALAIQSRNGWVRRQAVPPALDVDYKRIPCHTALLRQAAEGDGPARRFDRGDAVLPFVSSLPGQAIDRSRPQPQLRPAEAPRPPPPKTHRRRRAQRDAEDMLERRPVPVPPDPGPRIV